VTATHILEALAREYSSSPDHVHAVLEMLDAGLVPPLIGRFRRDRTGELPESTIRRIQRSRTDLEEMDRRRATVLRTLEGTEGVTEKELQVVRTTTDRFELEDMLLPHRRPEPEVQLALDRGLGELAALLVAPLPRQEEKEEQAETAAEPPTASDPGAEPAPAEGEPADGEQATDDEAPAAEAPEAEAPEAEVSVAEDGEDAAEKASEEPDPQVPREESPPTPAATEHTPKTGEVHASVALKTDDVLTPELARACQEFVRPDRGIHTEAEALAGAMRILADRLARDPRLRGLIRRMLRKRGTLSVKSIVPDNKAGRHRSLMNISQPMRQIQGHRLLALRQAQKERVLTTSITLEREVAMPKVLAALSRHRDPGYEGVLREVARRALEVRILPMIEGDIRLELKERGDEEALRFLSQHLRQVLLTPPCGRHPVAAVDVSARGDWMLVTLGESGFAAGPGIMIVTADKDAAALGAELRAGLGESRARTLAVGHAKVARAAVRPLRAALAAAGLDLIVHVVFDSGLGHYANSEGARKEFPDASVSERVALALGRRLQDPLTELLKVEPRYLGLGVEQGFVSKANLKRTYRDVIESCVALVGCDVNHVSASFLGFVPGLSREVAAKLATRAKETPFQNREELRGEGLLSEAEWVNAIAFLRIPTSDEPLDRTALHPEQYPMARRLLEAVGVSAQEGLGRPGLTRGLRRASFEVDEHTWRDLMRELTHPGRDPRPRLPLVHLLEGPVDPARLTKDRVVEGVVTNVASFGAFVDIGLEQDAMVHISEVSDRYVRDAREVLSIGQVVRGRILEKPGQRLAISLKNVPYPERSAPRERAPGKGGRGRERSGGRPHKARETQSNVRAAQSRRDGLGGTGRSRDGRRGGGRPGGGRHGGSGGREDRDGRVDLGKLEVSETHAGSWSPFAAFFDPGEKDKSPKDTPGETRTESATEKAPKPPPSGEPVTDESLDSVSEAPDVNSPTSSKEQAEEPVAEPTEKQVAEETTQPE
jgi:uncharacterized protein